ncbi:MAG: hypothetical protein JW819_12510 [Candidatus Krumholzibacteriota bacterium]|nr:hypothetical protein [Candidatus Krumholzibacteriota bacterium]
MSFPEPRIPCGAPRARARFGAFRARALPGVLLAVLAPCALPAGCAAPPVGEAALERALAANAATALHAPAVMDSLLAAERGLPTARRIGLWARRFLADPSSEYRFGLAPGGYVTEGLLASDHRQDCVSLLYRATELAQAADHRAALRRALATRFAGAPADSVIDAAGRADYDRPEHLDYSLDMIRAGHWGRDVTASLAGARPDSAGSARYPAGSFRYVPGTELDTRELREGDVAWFVLNPAHPAARRLREEHGLVIGHIGLLVEENGAILLIHAASSDLEGVYPGGRVASAPLRLYLERVDRFCGVVVTRFAD